MERTVANELFDALIKIFPPRRAYPADAFDHHRMPASLSHFLTQLLTDRIDREIEHLQRARSAWIDYDTTEVRRAQKALEKAYHNHAQVPADEWENVLRHSSDQVVSYLTRPVETLVDFVFDEGEGTRSMRLIQQRIGYFKDYTYLHDIIERYAERKGVETMTRSRFLSLLHRIDHQMVEDYGPDQWIRLLKPLFTLMETIPSLPGRAVPTGLLQAFFASKEVTTYVDRLQAASEDVLSPDRLRQLLKEREERTQPAREEVDRPDRADVSKRAPAPEEAQVQSEGPVPLWQQFQHGHRRPPSRPSSQEQSQPNRRQTASPSKTSGERVPRWKQFQPGPAQQPDAPQSPGDEMAALERVVLGRRGSPNRSLFIKQLFKGSKSDYKRVLQKLREASSWSQASTIIGREVFQKNKVNIYSDAAVTFTDTVQERFRK